MSLIERDSLLFQGADWDFGTIQRIFDAVEAIGVGELGLDVYPNQIEVITAEQMLDAYASIGMPLFYKHWSFGKRFAMHESSYRQGLMGLAYEIVINSNPCISYIMEENTATMQTLVIAHAAFGHNHFFKNNYLFKEWTDADGILDYLDFAKGYITRCEERYGHAAVERVLDAAHALMSHGVHRYPRKKKPDLRSEERRERERHLHQEQTFNDLWRTVPTKGASAKPALSDERRRALLELPQENILYFLEKSAPRLQPWQREILRIVRQIAQYFYPQRQTKVMNEGCATYTHYRIMTRLHETGQISDGAFLEFLQSHTNVTRQPEFDDPHYGGINPYALGFGMMQDIERICTVPTNEDRDWFPDIAGRGDAMGVLRDVWANYRDESFISQYLSPHLIRQWRMFHLVDDPHYGGINPYALGFGMMQDIERICTKPTAEDREWFPEIAGSGDAMAVLRDVWANYRDESFISQYLSPHLIRQWRMFHLVDDPDRPDLKIEAIHDERGYRRLRRSLSRHYDVGWSDPDIQVMDVDLAGDRRLILHHHVLNRTLLHKDDAQRVLQMVANLWGYAVVLKEVEPATGAIFQEHVAHPHETLF